MASNPPIPPTQPPYQQPYQQPPIPPPGYPGQPKKTSPLVWILIGCGGFVTLVFIVIAIFVFWVGRNPERAVAKMIEMSNPNIKIVEFDKRSKVIKVQNKKTGEILTIDLDEAKNGRFRFRNDKGEEVSIEAIGKDGEGTFRVKTNKSDVTFGSGDRDKVPEFVPLYPEAKLEADQHFTTPDGISGSFMFKTEDSPKDVVDRYRDELESAGFECEMASVDKRGEGTMHSLSAKAKDDQKHVGVTAVASKGEGKTVVTVVYQAKSPEH